MKSFAALSFAIIIALCAATFAATRAPEAQAQAPSSVTGYYVCELTINDGPTQTTYLSGVIPNTGFRPGPPATAFRDYLAGTYHLTLRTQPSCFESPSEARAREKFKPESHPGSKTVLTDWKYSGTGTPAAQTTSPTQPAMAASQAAGSGDIRGFCYLNFPGGPGYVSGQPTYFTAFSTFPDRDSTYRGLFAQYVAKKYSILHWSAPSCTAGALSAGQVEQSLQTSMAKVKELGGTIVQTSWTLGTHEALMAELAKNPPPAPAASPAAGARSASAGAAPTPSPTPRPSTSPAPAPQPAASAAPAPMYSFCYADGSPTGRAAGPVRYHFYITQNFARAATDRPEADFGKFLRAEHPGETFSTRCSDPMPLATVEKARDYQLSSKRKATNFDVVEVNWKR